jgi:hypothetical protein
MNFWRAAAAFLLAAGAAFAAPGAASVELRGAPNGRAVVSADDLAKLPRRAVEAVDRDGRKSKFEGWALGDVLALAGIPRGNDLRGKALATYVQASARDGYRVVFALPELDPAFTDRIVLLADRRDGVALESKDGPLRVVVPGERRQARWIRQVSVLSILNAPEEASAP